MFPLSPELPLKRLPAFRLILRRVGSAMFNLCHTPSMIVNNIPQSTMVQMAAFQFGYQPVWVVIHLSEHQASLGHMRKFDDEITSP